MFSSSGGSRHRQRMCRASSPNEVRNFKTRQRVRPDRTHSLARRACIQQPPETGFIPHDYEQSTTAAANTSSLASGRCEPAGNCDPTSHQSSRMFHAPRCTHPAGWPPSAVSDFLSDQDVALNTQSVLCFTRCEMRQLKGFKLCRESKVRDDEVESPRRCPFSPS